MYSPIIPSSKIIMPLKNIIRVAITEMLADIPCQAYEAIHDHTGDISLEYDVLVSLHVIDSATYYRYVEILPFYRDAIRNGVVLDDSG